MQRLILPTSDRTFVGNILAQKCANTRNYSDPIRRLKLMEIRAVIDALLLMQIYTETNCWVMA